MKTTPDNITKLEDNEIFVFGSNLKGYHGAGAAKDALNFGAKIGIGEGLCGKTYAIPTKDTNIRTMLLSDILKHVFIFICFARNHKSHVFLVTKIGCGYAGYTPVNIAPMFLPALGYDNIILPKDFLDILNKN